MVAVFLKLLNLSISASWLVLAVLVLRFALKRSPKWVNVLLWGIVALRLILPFSVESALSLIPSAETISPETVQFDPAPTITSGVSIIDNAVNPSFSESFAAETGMSVNPLYVYTVVAGYVWLIGLAAMLLYALVSYLHLRRRVSVSLRVRENIYLCDAIASPFILGVVKPRIYLPSTLDEVQQRNVLIHERAHLARRDHWWKPLGFALLAVYWFNPVLWLAYVLLCRDIELACDERVIRTMDENAVKTYSTVLLACSVSRKAVAACPLAFGEVGVKERVRNALHYKKPAFWIVAASVIVCIGVAVCFLTNPEHETMKWAKNLRVEDVVRVELTIMPQAADKQYKDFNADEIAEAVAFINKSSGRYISEPEPLSGSMMTLYVTTTGGVQHTVTNNGNVYLCIDGDAYRSTHNTWPYTEGDSPLPDGLQAGNTQAVGAKRIYADDWSICIVGRWLRNAGTREWWSDSSDAYLNVVKQTSLAEELTGLQNAGHAIEESDGYYRCVTQEGLSNTVVYLYPVPSGGSCYWVEIHWSYDNADESEVELQARQLRMMAESFRVENGSSTADSLSGSYTGDTVNPVLKNWVENNIDGPVYVPVKWAPVCSCENVAVFSSVQDDFYQLDFYQSSDENYAGDQVYPLSDAKVNQADFLGSLSRSKDRFTGLKMESTDVCTEINLDDNVTVFSNEHSTMCYWTINGWNFNYVGPSLTKSEELKADILKLSSAWDTVEIAEAADGRIDIVSGNQNTVYYSWKKDGYYWEFALPDIDSAAAVTVLNSFEKW